MVALAAVALALAVLQGSSISTAYARPLLPAFTLGPAAPPVVGGAPLSIQPWEVVPAGANDPVIPPGRATVQVPILMYHYIRVPPDPSYDRMGWGLSTSPDDFRAQMAYLDEHGYHPVTLSHLRGYLEGSRSLPNRPVVLTFDDGYADFYLEAYPVLRQHRFKAVAYIVSGFVGRDGVNVTADQVREMDSHGIEIGAHTQNHVDLTKSGPDSQWAEVKGSKDFLEALLGHPVLDFCYPSGRYNAAVIQTVQRAGYQSATTTESGTAHNFSGRYAWSRVRVSGGESLEDFGRGLEQPETGVPPLVPTIIRIPRTYPLVYPGPFSGLE